MIGDLDLRGIPNWKIYTQQEKFDKAKIQENFVREQILKRYPQNTSFVRLTEETTSSQNTEINRCCGDIQWVYNNEIKWIDLKVAEYDQPLDKYGTVDLNSYLVFGYKTSQPKNRFYILVNANGSDYKIIDAYNILDRLINIHHKFILESKQNRNEGIYYNCPQYDFLKKYYIKGIPDNISGKDFFPTHVLKSLDVRYKNI